MKAVAIHVTTVPQTFGFFCGMFRSLGKRGYRVVAIASEGESLGRFAAGEGCRAVAVNMSREITPFRDLLSLARLAWFFVSFSPEIVHAHTPKAGVLSMIACKMVGVPIALYHIHGFPFVTASGFAAAALRITERVACAFANRVFAVGEGVRSVALKERFVAASKISVIGYGSINGIDAEGRFNPVRFGAQKKRELLSQLNIPQDGRIIGFVGRLVRDKGVVELTQAWQRLSAEDKRIHLIVVGEKEVRDSVPEQYLKLLVDDPRVHMLGHLEKVEQWYSTFDVLVLPTYREGLPYVPLEAAAMQVPCVVTRVPGCSEAVIDGETGTLVPPRDVEAIVSGIKRYLADAELSRLHGERARQRVLTCFRPELIWEKMCWEYESMLKRGGMLDVI